MKNQKSKVYVIIAALAVGLSLAATEYAARQSGLELRTFAQAWKGFYLWLAMPCIILLAGNSLIRTWFEQSCGEEEEERKYRFVRNGLRRVLFVLFLVLIFVSAFLRGLFYIFSRDMVTERVLPDGYIEGTWSDFLSESRRNYYAPAGGIFRKPFPGWTEEQLTEIVHEKYSPEAECVERQEDDIYVFRTPDALDKDGYIYFHVMNSYHAGSNYYFQVLCSEASHFWGGRDRRVTVTVWEEEDRTPEEALDGGAPMSAGELYTSGKLSVSCGNSAMDMAACAADLTDWLQFVRDTGQLPYDREADVRYLLTDIILRSGEGTFLFEIRPLEDFMGEDPWEERYLRMKEEIESAFSEYEERSEEYRKNVEYMEAWDDRQKEAYGKDFVDIYDGSYEKECLVGDGSVRYRMVVEDAALGSRFYGLLKSTDGGETWQMSNPDPFDQQMGMGIDFIFLDEQFGFATLMHNGGDEADLYVTEDGGDSYEGVIIEGYTVTLEDGFTYEPYDYPQMPYEEGGELYMLCGQGADGDYAGGDAAGLALYRSGDGGHTFTFVEIRKP